MQHGIFKEGDLTIVRYGGAAGEDRELRLDKDFKLAVGDVAPEMQQRLLHLRKQGYEVEIGEDGILLLSGVPERSRRITMFFSNEPPFFPGCEELRAAYRRELESLRASEGCNVACAEAKLTRRYMDKVSALLPP